MANTPDDKRGTVTVLCAHCHGDGIVPVPVSAMLGGAPRTVVATRPCPWCDDGRRRFRPPV